MKTGYLILCLSIILGEVTAQSADTLEAYQHLENGHKQYRELRNYDSASFYYRQAGLMFREAKFPERYAFCLIREGLCKYRQNALQEALGLFKNSLDIYESLYPEDHLTLAVPYTRLGSVYSQMGNYHQALDYFKRTLYLRQLFQGEDHLQTGVAYYNLGTALMYYGEYQNGMQAYQNALRIYLAQYGESHRRLSSLYVNMGILYDKRGESEKALEYYEKSSKIDRELYGEQHFLLAYNYYNMAIAYINSDQPEQAEQLYHQTIELSEPNNIYHLLANAHYGLGNLAKSEGDLSKAESLYLEAIGIFVENFGADHPGINHTYRALAALWEERGSYQRAREYLQQSLDLLQRNYGANHPFIALTYQQIAKLESEQDRFQVALEELDRGFRALSKGNGELGAPEDFTDRRIFMDLLQTRSSILQDKYHRGGRQVEDLQEALRSFQKAVSIIDEVRRGYILDDSKLFLQQEALVTYEKAIECAVELYQNTGDAIYLDNIHEFIEKSKATVLAEALQGNTLKKIQGVPDSLLKQEVELKQLINYVESSLSGSAGTVLDSLENQLFVLKRSYDTLAQHLFQEHPKYYDLKYQVEVADPRSIQSVLPEGSAVLNYFLGDSNWYVYSIGPQHIDIHVIDSLQRMKMDLERFRRLAINNEEAYDRELAYILYEELIQKPLHNKGPFNRLIVVPYGGLGHLPFDAFLTSREETETGKLPFLVAQYAISYTPSLTLMQVGNTSETLSEDYRGFAPSYSSWQQKDLPEIKGTMEEVNYARSIFKGQVYLESEATESIFKLSTSGAKILHLAMHGLIDDQDPMNSRLVFTQDTSSQDDGNLYAHEIYDLQLPSQLAVLSACNTGYGEIARGEGIMNLSRAFQFAGSPNIIMSLWQAKDQSSSQIMADFFGNIKAGMPKDVALQQAKLKFLESADPFKAHPSQWATFVFVGNTDPLNFSKNTWKWVALLATFVILLAWYFHRRRAI